MINLATLDIGYLGEEEMVEKYYPYDNPANSLEFIS